ncbi:uncharacterized protein LOC117172464 isoform X2 [Belonocnema kinseyi]|uniref:uncharacterized protein LOC117172464 isoform X2 n=1 Tax=Belonocnema kinseyi TaxID=2817044 RepID=UPI00143D1AEB|nr:uncharacterized protein LOC117172464 isoform X2 [Belonocnema kinseyi]
MEEERLDFNFEISLQRLCVVKIATNLWEKEEIRQKVLLFFQKNYNRYEENDNSIGWNKVTKKVLSFLKNVSLPAKLSHSIKHVTKSIGLQIFNWTKYVTKILKFDIICTSEIFWTHFGTIDKRKIFEHWVQTRKLKSSQLFNMACIFCMEDYIPNLWIEIPDYVKTNEFYSETIYTMSKYNLIAYWKNVLLDDMRRNFISTMAVTERVRIERLRAEGRFENDEFNERRIAWLYIFADSHSTEENMFRVSVLEGLELGVKYFWNKLSDEQRQRNVEFALHTAKGKSEEPEYAEILIFLLTKLSVEQNISLSYEEFFILEMLLKNWPWEEFFTPVFDRILEFYENSTNRDVDNYETKFFYLIQAIVGLMKNDFALYECVEGTRYQNILHETWEKIPESSKILVAGKRDWSIFSKLLNIEDLKSLKMIINHEVFRKTITKRNSFISCMKSLFLTLESKNKIELIEKFVSEIGIDEDEIFKLRANFALSCL